MFMPSVKRMEVHCFGLARRRARACRGEGGGGEGLEIPLVGGGASLNEAAHKMTATKIRGDRPDIVVLMSCQLADTVCTEDEGRFSWLNEQKAW